MNKKDFRKLFRNKRGSLVSKNKSLLDKKIYSNFFSSSIYKTSNNIMVFLSFNTEVDTHNIIKTLIKNGKNVFVPITDPKTKELYVSKLESFEDLELGFYNILTPKRTKINLFDPEVLDLVLVPGLVFDKFGYRIGYGGGYYDKFLSQANLRAQTIGLCYFIQIVDKFPVEEYDIPVDYILTEKKLMESL